jgi:hypothetical protein|tara:strand:+ start:229 stop:729 length:501 start_codon:yes stop_codon:yes gene_type:complete
MKKIIVVLVLGLAFTSCNEKAKEKMVTEPNARESALSDSSKKIIYVKNKNNEGKEVELKFSLSAPYEDRKLPIPDETRLNKIANLAVKYADYDVDNTFSYEFISGVEVPIYFNPNDGGGGMNVVIKGKALNMSGIPISVTTTISFNAEGEVTKYPDGRLQITTVKY